MRRVLFPLVVVLLACAAVTGASAQTTIYNWNFNVGTPPSGEQWPATIPATTGAGSLTHIFTDAQSFAGTTVNAEPGDLAGGSFCPRGDANNLNYFTLTVPTTGYVGIVLSYATQRTSTGFSSQEIQYSLDGSAFTTLTTLTSIPTAYETRSFDFSAISGANGNPNFKIRIIVDGATASAGNNRFDNLKVQGFPPGVNDGDGSATVSNNAGTFLGSTIFPRNAGGQTVLVGVTGVPGGTLTSVRLTVPAGWSGLSAPNVTLGGAFASLTPSVTATQVSITGATLGTTPGTIQITGLTSNNPIGALNNGNSIWQVETATSGGTLTPIANSPRSHTIIPIENIRTGGVDGFGNSDASGLTSAMNGQVVAVQGIATVQNQIVSAQANQTSFFIQQGGFGLQVFRNAAPSIPWVRGDDMVVRGTIETFDGSTEVVPATGGAPDFYNLGAAALPSPLVLPNANAITEQHEGKLVRVNSVTWDSAGLTFTAAVGPRNSFRTAPTDTGTLFMTATNPLVGITIPGSSNVTGIVYHRNAITGSVVPRYKLVARDLVDLGFDPADGTGTAMIAPLGRLANQSAVAETLTVTGDGTHTLGGVSVTIPASWSWNGTSFALSGAGFSGASSVVSGDGSSGNPWVITVSNAAVTNTNTGVVRMFNLGTPSTTGPTTFVTKTRGAAGTLANIAVQPIVNIGSAFEAVASGNWSSPSTWAGGSVPTANDDVTLSTLGVTVTIDIDGAVCRNLTMTGSGSASNSGPVLQFDAAGTRSLTVNGNLSVSGGSGGGSGDRGGRPKFWSNGNTSAVLTVTGNIFNGSSNTPANGDAGISMNTGVVRMIGATSDTIRFGAGMRLGALEIGNGVSAKTVRTVITTGTARLAITGLTVKQNSTLWIGTETNTNILAIGNSGDVGVPVISNGILVENGASLRVLESAAGFVQANLNVDGGTITNNGTIDLVSPALSPLTGCVYNLRVGGHPAGTAGGTVTVAGANVGSWASVTIDSAKTLALNQDMNIVAFAKVTINNGILAETAGNTVIGRVEATRSVAQSVPENFGGIGLEINAAGAAPGATIVSRVTGSPQVSGTSSSIARYFDISPINNSGLNATLNFFYDNSELGGQTASTLTLWKSTNSGATWSPEGGTVDVGQRRVQVTGVGSLSRWTAADNNNPLTGFTVPVNIADGWNLISSPVARAPQTDSVRHLYPTSSFPYAFGWSGSGYFQTQTMPNGPGFWGKFPGATVSNVSGGQLTNLAVSVFAGWNIVGSLSGNVDTSTITSTPPGLRASNWFGYSGSYVPVTQLVPGKGYWVKSSGAGQFNFTSPGPVGKAQGGADLLAEMNTVTITDNTGASQTLYIGSGEGIDAAMFVMPPAPPEGAFDARFAGSEGGTMLQAHGASADRSYPVEIRTTAYPVTVSWKISKGEYELSAGELTRAMTGEGSLVLPRSGNVAIRVVSVDGGLPTEFVLGQNYPNPFNPLTSIRFALPVDSRVVVRVYNTLGQLMTTIVNADLASGYHHAQWDGRTDVGVQAASGVYFYRIDAVAIETGTGFHEIKKMLLMK